jgi:hypothetical protein
MPGRIESIVSWRASLVTQGFSTNNRALLYLLYRIRNVDISTLAVIRVVRGPIGLSDFALKCDSERIIIA